MDAPPSTRRSPALIPRERGVGLRRIAIGTALGRVVVRAGRRADGPATILLHGAAGSWTTWTPLLAAADAASAPLTDVVAPDLPGWGDSGTLPRGTDVGAMSDAVVEIARSLGYTRWRVVGHSLGGFIALDLAARHPRETIAVVLVSPSGAGVVDALRPRCAEARGCPDSPGCCSRCACSPDWVRRGGCSSAHSIASVRCGRSPHRSSPGRGRCTDR
ncbi:alpha/beta fold hydrolase [Microbacterium sp.]|uniref:alpha/beta fold hydrolase n=1 Tax=Microbacterium sp. TaxID=51671 RepID=UPI001AD2155A|nr:alpha/beta fold hydrolase [Microbacterium sp.]MBN9188133.1 alpha/beta fold hydrolase [Microbacterium sp.]MBN9192910.1 alpha/beta fold hydrolase [Microbacterium sp.]